MAYFPNVPVLFGDLYFVFAKNNLKYWINLHTVSFYVCYKKNSHYDVYFVNASKILFNNMIFTLLDQVLSLLTSIEQSYSSYFDSISLLHHQLKKYHLTSKYTSTICNRSSMYQCIHSMKCISIYRLFDGIDDCPYMDDENNNTIEKNTLIEQLKKTH